MRNAHLGPRLLNAAEFVRQGAVFADVGTDHAYLPLFLLSEGKIERAVASDINEGPLASARANAEAAGLLDKMEFVLTDGARELDGRGITDMAICGMGGELIADIVKCAPYLHKSGIRLILQPMSRQAHLRRALYAMGFEISAESYSSELHHHYVTILAEYRGEASRISDFLAEAGLPPYNLTPPRRSYLTARLEALRRSASGKKDGGADSSYEDSLIPEFEKILEV